MQSKRDYRHSHTVIKSIHIVASVKCGYWKTSGYFFFHKFYQSKHRFFSTFKIQNSKVSFKVGTIRTIKQVLITIMALKHNEQHTYTNK